MSRTHLYTATVDVFLDEDQEPGMHLDVKIAPGVPDAAVRKALPSNLRSVAEAIEQQASEDE